MITHNYNLRILQCALNLKQIADTDLVRQITSSGGKLFCKACRELLVLKKSVLADAHEKHDKQTYRKGETLNEETKVYSAAFSLVQPSSATAERVFSLLGQTFGDQRQNALEDLVEASVMLQFNSR